MKSVVLSVAGCTMLLALSLLSSAAAQVAGGWSKASVKDVQVTKAAEFAINAQQQALKNRGEKEKLTLEKVVSAEQQVVQGMNYRLLLQVRLGDSVKKAQAVVWVRLWLAPDERYKLTSWEFTEEKKAKP